MKFHLIPLPQRDARLLALRNLYIGAVFGPLTHTCYNKLRYKEYKRDSNLVIMQSGMRKKGKQDLHKIATNTV